MALAMFSMSATLVFYLIGSDLKFLSCLSLERQARNDPYDNTVLQNNETSF